MQTHKISEVMTPDAMRYGAGTRCDKDFILNIITRYSMHTIHSVFGKYKSNTLKTRGSNKKQQKKQCFHGFYFLKAGLFDR